MAYTRTGLRRTPGKLKPDKASKIFIRIPQSAVRPIRITSHDLFVREFLRPDFNGFIHRRGIRRPLIGVDPQEQRADQTVNGTLPERILYSYLYRKLNFRPGGVDFDFQSSLQGGRMELGGLVADFMFRKMKLIIRVQGPTHTEFARFRKDEEQRLALEQMGFSVVDVDWLVILDETRMEQWARATFGLAMGSGSAMLSQDSAFSFGGQESENNPIVLNRLWDKAISLQREVFDWLP
jgi:hypothetical protein